MKLIILLRNLNNFKIISGQCSSVKEFLRSLKDILRIIILEILEEIAQLSPLTVEYSLA
jgi:hypothetical protein